MTNKVFQQNLDDKKGPSQEDPISFRCCSKSRWTCRIKKNDCRNGEAHRINRVLLL